MMNHIILNTFAHLYSTRIQNLNDVIHTIIYLLRTSRGPWAPAAPYFLRVAGRTCIRIRSIRPRVVPRGRGSCPGTPRRCRPSRRPSAVAVRPLPSQFGQSSMHLSTNIHSL